VCLILLATGGSIAFWTFTSDARAVLVASRDLPAGATLGPSDLAISRVRVDDSLYQAAIPASDLTSLVGRQLGEPIHARQILARAQVSTRPRLGPGQLALTIAISPDTAVGGTLRPGDEVEVLLTTDKDKPDVRTSVVLPRAIVYDVGHATTVGAVNVDAANVAVSPGQVRWLTLVVTQDQAVQLARARWAGDLDVALLPPVQGSEKVGVSGSQSGQ
jgi:Flp pilus assembly protein CpaB